MVQKINAIIYSIIIIRLIESSGVQAARSHIVRFGIESHLHRVALKEHLMRFRHNSRRL